MNTELIEQIYSKYEALGENPESYLKGLLTSQPITYWDYVETDTLLSLQKPRTAYKDEAIFIMYHQVTELTLKMMLHEIKQLTTDQLSDKEWINKMERLNRYTSLLITSFDIMKSGMNYDDYNTFRYTLTPASGFQSVQFRMIELYCTPLVNLVNEQGKMRLSANPTIEEYMDNLYWKDAGCNRNTGKKSLTLQAFENRYQEQLTSLAYKMEEHTLSDKVKKRASLPAELKEKLREFDYLYNIQWPLVHLQTAQHYLDSKHENKAATGGSEWKKYLHPKYQQRKFFPDLWTKDEKNSWGIVSKNEQP